MATPPTPAQTLELAFNASGTTKTTGTFDVLTGDIIVVKCLAEDHNPSPFTVTNNSTALTWTDVQSGVDVTNFCGANMKYTVMAAPRTGLTVSVARTGTGVQWFGGTVTVWRGSPGVGGTGAKQNATNGVGVAASMNLTTTGDNSAIELIQGDFNAKTGTVTARTINSITPTAGNGMITEALQDASHYGAYSLYWTDAGTAGVKAVGISAPTEQKCTIIALEILGGSGSTTETPTPGVATAAGITPATTATAAPTAGANAAAAGITPAARQPITPVAIPATGTAPTTATTAAVTPGVATASGITPTAATTATPTPGSVTTAGTEPGARVAVSPGAATGVGVSPTDGTSSEATPIPGVAQAAGISPASSVVITTLHGVASTASTPPAALVTLPAGTATAAGITGSATIRAVLTVGVATATGISPVAGGGTSPPLASNTSIGHATGPRTGRTTSPRLAYTAPAVGRARGTGVTP